MSLIARRTVVVVLALVAFFAAISADAAPAKGPELLRNIERVGIATNKAQVDLAVIDPYRGEGKTISVRLPGKAVKLVKSRVEKRGPKNFAWLGKVAGEPFSTSVLTVSEGKLFGYIEAGGSNYSIQPQGASYTVVKADPEAAVPFDTDGRPVSSSSVQAPLAEFAPNFASEDGSQIDLMALFTQKMRDRYGSAVEGMIQNYVDITNAAYENSGIESRINLVHTELYSSSSAVEGMVAISDALTHITGSSTIADLRNEHGADLVTLIRTLENEPYCGLAYVAQYPASFQEYAYSVSQVRLVSEGGSYCDQRTVAHELGHNLGSTHDRNHSSSPGAYSYSYGYDVSGVFATIMSYASPTISYFSTPLITYSGYPIGVAEGESNSADNVKSINQTRLWAANYRESNQTPDITVSPDAKQFGSVLTGQSGSAQTFTVTNTGSGSLHIGELALGGGDPGSFSITSDGCSDQIVTAGSCTFAVNFSPQSDGTKDATVVIPSNDADEASVAVLLGGLGVDPGPAPVTTLTTDPLTPDVAGDWFSASADVTFTLSADTPGQTYFQWDGTADSGWTSYDLLPEGEIPPEAPEGQHTLYYYSVSATGVEEEIKDQVIKVDSTPPTGSVTLASGQGYTNAATVTAAIVGNDGGGSGVTEMRLSSDGTFDGSSPSESWAAYDEVFSWPLSAGDGAKHIYVQLRDLAGHESLIPYLTDSIILDTVAPSAKLYSPELSVGQSGKRQVNLKWGQSGSSVAPVATYKVRYKRGVAGSWVTIYSNTAKVSYLLKSLALGQTYYFAVGATDQAGNVGSYRTTDKTTIPYDDYSGTVTSGRWTRVKSSTLPDFNGSIRYTSSKNGALKFAASGRKVSLVGRRSPSGAKVRIYVDGKYVSTVNTYASSKQYRRILFSKSFSKIGYHSIKVVSVPVSASRNKTFVDGVAFIR